MEAVLGASARIQALRTTWRNLNPNAQHRVNPVWTDTRYVSGRTERLT